MLKISILGLLNKKIKTFFALIGIIISSFFFVLVINFSEGFENFIMANSINYNGHLLITPRQPQRNKEDLVSNFYKKDTIVLFSNHLKPIKKEEFILTPEIWYKRLLWDNDVEAFFPKSEDFFQKSRNNSHIIVSNKSKNTSIVKIIGTYMSEWMNLFIDNTYTKSVFENKVKEIISSKLRVKSIWVRLKNSNNASKKALEWKDISNEKIETWKEINKNFLNLLNFQKITLFLFLIITFSLASLGTFIALKSIVENKKMELLKHKRIFIIQSILLGFLGGAIGVYLGHLACLFIEVIPIDTTNYGPLYINVPFKGQIYIMGLFLSFFSTISFSLIITKISFIKTQ